MAEWPFTDFFQPRVSTSCDRRGELVGPFHPGKSLFPHKAHPVKNGYESQENQKAQSEKQFGSDQLPNEVHLQKQDYRNKDR